MTTKEKLKLIQQLSKLTQTELASQLNVSFPTLNSWINGRSQPHTKKLIHIDALYAKFTGETTIHQNPLTAKKAIIKTEQNKTSNIIRHINTRPDLFDQLILSFTYNSNSIEGSTLTEKDTAAIIFRKETIKNKNLIEHLEAKNHQTALEYLFNEIKLNYKITEAQILKLHSILMNSIIQDAGTYRNHGVRIVGANVPTANHLRVPELMKNLVEEINKKEKDTIKHATIIHSKFEQIHPFSDGNGRIGRILMAAMLLRKNIAPAIIKQEQRKYYYQYLQQSQQKSEHSNLEEFICNAVLNGFKILSDNEQS